MQSAHVAVIIVGAGPTGLAAANLLGQASIETLLVERATEPSLLPRAISIDDEGLRVCQALGLREAVLPDVMLGIGAQYFSHGRLLARATPTSQHNGYPLISTFNQPRLEASLLAGLQRFPCVQIGFQQEFVALEQSENEPLVHVTLRLPDGTLRNLTCAYLLACDGAHSPVRHLLGIRMRGTSFQQRWLVVDSLQDSDRTPFATFYCEPRRPIVSVPAPGQARRWEFMLLPGEADLDAPTLKKLIQQVGGPAEPLLIRQAIYTFHATLASRFSQGRVFLLGDAAHLLPPFGGQGLNCGLRDAGNLAWKLALVLRNFASPALLATYQQERQPHNARLIRFSSFLGSLIMPTNPLLAWLRDRAFQLLNLLPVFRGFLAEARIKPPPDYRRGLLLRRYNRRLAGKLLPQPQVRLSSGETQLLDELLGNGFALLCVHTEPHTAFASLTAPIWQHMDVRRVCLVPTDQAETAEIGEDGEEVMIAVDTEQVISNFLRAGRADFVLVRPDRYILGAFRASQAEAFAESLRCLLARQPEQRRQEKASDDEAHDPKDAVAHS